MVGVACLSIQSCSALPLWGGNTALYEQSHTQGADTGTASASGGGTSFFSAIASFFGITPSPTPSAGVTTIPAALSPSNPVAVSATSSTPASPSAPPPRTSSQQPTAPAYGTSPGSPVPPPYGAPSSSPSYGGIPASSLGLPPFGVYGSHTPAYGGSPANFTLYTQGSPYNTSTITADDLLRNGRFYLRYGNVVANTSSWAWSSAVTGEVKEQGECHACYAFATIGAIEAIHAIRTGGRTNLSEAQMVQCSSNYKCTGGWMPRAYQFAQDVGLVSDAIYSYNASELDSGVAHTCSLGDPSTNLRIIAYEDVPTSDGALLKAVSNQPVVAAIDASSVDFMTYRGTKPFTGVCSSDPQSATHAVLVVGYNITDPDNGYWILKNTWGTGWGDSGYFYLPMSDSLVGVPNKCGILNYLSYPVVDGVPPANKRLDLLASYCSTPTPFVVTTLNITLPWLAADRNVTVQQMLDVNLHLATYAFGSFLELDEYIFIPPCTAGVPPPPVPTAACGYDYHVDGSQSAPSYGAPASYPPPSYPPSQLSPPSPPSSGRHRRQLLTGSSELA
ncbi:MAG: hypothetical protein WDW36_006878 [Sanguina aurantia]